MQTSSVPSPRRLHTVRWLESEINLGVGKAGEGQGGRFHGVHQLLPVEGFGRRAGAPPGRPGRLPGCGSAPGQRRPPWPGGAHAIFIPVSYTELTFDGAVEHDAQNHGLPRLLNLLLPLRCGPRNETSSCRTVARPGYGALRWNFRHNCLFNS